MPLKRPWLLRRLLTRGTPTASFPQVIPASFFTLIRQTFIGPFIRQYFEVEEWVAFYFGSSIIASLADSDCKVVHPVLGRFT